MTLWQSLMAALKGGAWAGLANTIIGVAVTIGLVSANQSSALSALVAGGATLLNLIVALIHTFQQAKTLRTNAHLRFLLSRNTSDDISVTFSPEPGLE